jgi:hypothetical protein
VPGAAGVPVERGNVGRPAPCLGAYELPIFTNIPSFHSSGVPAFQSAIRGGKASGRGPIVQNEPNLSIADCGLRIADRLAVGRLPCGLLPWTCAGQSCKTKPIWPERPEMGAHGRGRRGQNMQNEPNSLIADRRQPCGGTGRARCASDPQGTTCTKRTQLDPASPGPRWGKDTKRTQFWGVGRWVESPLFRYSIIPPFPSDANRAKRTQFAVPDR